MQLEDLAREVLVEPAGAIDSRDRVGAHRRRLIEIEEHARVALGGLQQVGEATHDVGADGLTLVCARHTLDLVGRNAEVVRPKPHQPLGKAALSGERRIDAHARLVEIDLAPGVGNSFGRRSGRHVVVGLLIALGGHGRLLLDLRGDDALGLALGVGVGDGAKGQRAARKPRRRNLPYARLFEFGEEGAAGIRRDGGD